ncbi:hypothetical protein APV28_3971 [Comamonas testosteroni]|nr:hypothetical protein APV28_3971 [Comamonas testosteroni]
MQWPPAPLGTRQGRNLKSAGILGCPTACAGLAPHDRRTRCAIRAAFLHATLGNKALRKLVVVHTLLNFLHGCRPDRPDRPVSVPDAIACLLPEVARLALLPRSILLRSCSCFPAGLLFLTGIPPCKCWPRSASWP